MDKKVFWIYGTSTGKVQVSEREVTFDSEFYFPLSSESTRPQFIYKVIEYSALEEAKNKDAIDLWKENEALTKELARVRVLAEQDGADYTELSRENKILKNDLCIAQDCLKMILGKEKAEQCQKEIKEKGYCKL